MGTGKFLRSLDLRGVTSQRYAHGYTICCPLWSARPATAAARLALAPDRAAAVAAVAAQRLGGSKPTTMSMTSLPQICRLAVQYLKVSTLLVLHILRLVTRLQPPLRAEGSAL